MTRRRDLSSIRNFEALCAKAASSLDAAAVLVDLLLERDIGIDPPDGEERRALRLLAGADRHLPVRVSDVEVNLQPRVAGEGPRWTTRGGEPIRYPGAYRRAYGKPIYVPSERALVVGRNWLVSWRCRGGVYMSQGTGRDPLSPAEARRRARELIEQWRRGDQDVLPVLADALLYSDAPEVGEDLAYALGGRSIAGKRGQAVRGKSALRGIVLVMDRVEEELSFPTAKERAAYDVRERLFALREIRAIEDEWRTLSRAERQATIESTVQWHQTEANVLYQRGKWLFSGEFGHGARLLAREIASLPSRRNREALLYRLLLAVDHRLPAAVANQIWSRLTPLAKRNATQFLRAALEEQGVEVTERRAERPR